MPSLALLVTPSTAFAPPRPNAPETKKHIFSTIYPLFFVHNFICFGKKTHRAHNTGAHGIARRKIFGSPGNIGFHFFFFFLILYLVFWCSLQGLLLLASLRARKKNPWPMDSTAPQWRALLRSFCLHDFGLPSATFSPSF